MDGFTAGGDTDLIAGPVAANHGAGSVGAVTVAIAGSAGVGTGRVPPIVVVINGRSVPAALLVDQSRMIPIKAGVVAGQNHATAVVSQSPGIVSLDEADIGFNSGDFWC